MRQQQIENISDPQTWDMERMHKDLMPMNDYQPIRMGAFPVPHYDLLGPYRGGGFMGNAKARSIPDYKLVVEDKEIVFDSFFIGDSPFYEEARRNRSFFTIMTVIDTVDTNGFTPGASSFLSRNHPDYGGQGSVSTKNNRLDYVAFTTPDKGSFAIVNMRLFHLEYGDLIVVTPQKDGSFRSLQIHSKGVKEEELFDYIKNEVLKREDVLSLITESTVISGTPEVPHEMD